MQKLFKRSFLIFAIIIPSQLNALIPFVSVGIGTTFVESNFFLEVSAGLSVEGSVYGGAVMNLNQDLDFQLGAELGTLAFIGVDYLYDFSKSSHIIRAYPVIQSIYTIHWNVMAFPFYQYNFDDHDDLDDHHVHDVGLSLKVPLLFTRDGPDFFSNNNF